MARRPKGGREQSSRSPMKERLLSHARLEKRHFRTRRVSSHSSAFFIHIVIRRRRSARKGSRSPRRKSGSGPHWHGPAIIPSGRFGGLNRLSAEQRSDSLASFEQQQPAKQCGFERRRCARFTAGSTPPTRCISGTSADCGQSHLVSLRPRPFRAVPYKAELKNARRKSCLFRH